MIKVRKALSGDGRLVAQLLFKKYTFSSSQEAEEIFKSECSTQHYRLAEENGKIAGLISWRPQGTSQHGVIELTRLAIAPEVEDKWTVKEMLFDVMVAEADFYYKQRQSKLRKVFSMIHADNRDIKEFFLNKGMQQEAVLRDHFQRGKDELVFSLFFA